MVNGRIVPGETPEQVQKELEATFRRSQAHHHHRARDTGSDPSAMNKDLLAAIEKVCPKFWPGVPAVPTMTAGATDGRFLRNIGIPTYGHSGDGVGHLRRSRPRQGRTGVDPGDVRGRAVLYELVKALSGG